MSEYNEVEPGEHYRYGDDMVYVEEVVHSRAYPQQRLIKGRTVIGRKNVEIHSPLGEPLTEEEKDKLYNEYLNRRVFDLETEISKLHERVGDHGATLATIWDDIAELNRRLHKHWWQR